ncbi:uncharacterized protein LOC129290438 [Prosopis cineraria]|uniref:uncharacterized protein LOC129290438 n=1 Tax=Prosopis cineraria TaxID=364024 RepID=UPI00240FCD61|nr:uncharacterized protein LOC129290438 [Prosopis cineraria]
MSWGVSEAIALLFKVRSAHLQLFMSEAMAFRKALDLIRNLQIGKCIIETDCAMLYNCLVSGSTGSCDWRCQVVIEDVLVALKSLSNVVVSLISRSMNESANWLAVNSSKRLCPVDWVERPPTSLARVLKRDLAQALGVPGVFFCRKGIG